MSSTSSAPWAAASSSPRRSARYSATLLVASPIVSPTCSTTAPSSLRTTTPIAAGPGLPRAPPSTFTVSLPIDSAMDRPAVGGGAAARGDHHHPAIMRGRVPLARGGVDLVDLEALAELVDRAQLVAEVDAPLVPGQLPGD